MKKFNYDVDICNQKNIFICNFHERLSVGITPGRSG